MTLNNREAITELNAKLHFQKTLPLSVVDVAFAQAACYFTQDFKEIIYIKIKNPRAKRAARAEIIVYAY